MVQLQNFFFFITSMVVPRGTAAPVLLKWFVSRDVPTGAPSSNGTLIPIPIPSFPLLVYLHSRKFIRSMDGAKSRVLVNASRPQIFPAHFFLNREVRFFYTGKRRASKALLTFVPLLHFLLLESTCDFSYFESFCGVLRLLFFCTFFSLPRNRSAKRERVRRSFDITNGLRKSQSSISFFSRRNDLSLLYSWSHFSCCYIKKLGLNLKELSTSFFHFLERLEFGKGRGASPSFMLKALTLPTSRHSRLYLLYLPKNGHDYSPFMNQNISHGGVCIFILGVLLSNTFKCEFTQRLPLGSELHMGKERCCLRGLDHLHGPTFHSICGNLMIYKPSLTPNNEIKLIFSHLDTIELRANLMNLSFASFIEMEKEAIYPKKVTEFLHFFSSAFFSRHQKNREQKNFWLTMFPEKRYFRERTSTTEVAIHTNPFTDLYAPIGTGSSRTGGWYNTIMKLPFLFLIRIGFLLASLGGSRSLLRQLQKEKLRWNRESFVEFIIA